MIYVVIWDEFQSGDYIRHVEVLETLADAEEFVGAVNDVIDYDRRNGQEVMHVYEVTRELYPHPASMDAIVLRDYPLNDE